MFAAAQSLEFGQPYEFVLIPHMHPYHQHVNPFQLQQDVGLDGFMGKAGDWFDTVGGPKDGEYRFRTRPLDFAGKQIVHCHLLTHEDRGMMTFVDILQPHQTCDAATGTIVGEPTTAAPSSAPPSSAPTLLRPSPFTPSPQTLSPSKADKKDKVKEGQQEGRGRDPRRLRA